MLSTSLHQEHPYVTTNDISAVLGPDENTTDLAPSEPNVETGAVMEPPTNQTAQIHSFDLDQLPHEQPPTKMDECVYIYMLLK